LLTWQPSYRQLWSPHVPTLPSGVWLLTPLAGETTPYNLYSTSCRLMYWTDWGEVVIERASMDGANREVIHSIGLAQPSGITVDWHSQTVFWTDSILQLIEGSQADGSGREVLYSLTDSPVKITVDGSTVFWSDTSGHVRAGHRSGGGNVTTLLSTLTGRPWGVEVVSPQRQPQGQSCKCINLKCNSLALNNVL